MRASEFIVLVRGLEGAALLVALLAAHLTVAGLVISARRGSRGRALGHPLLALIAAAVVVALGAIGQWAITHHVLDTAFAPTDDGWRRVAAAEVDAGTAMTMAASLQRFLAIVVASLVPLSWLAAWKHDPDAEPSAVAASVAATFAMSLPVLAGCAGVVWMADTMAAAEPSEAVWSTWHGLEAAKWAVAGVAAIGLMAATPIVMHAASRGNVVSARTSQLAQVMLLVGLAAWSTSRFANEDLVRGPMASLERGDEAWHRRAEHRGLPALAVSAVELPTASRCSEEAVDPNRQQLLFVHLDASGHRLDAAPWPKASASARERVLLAAIDRRAPASVYRPTLQRAREAGVKRVALLTARDDTEATLTLGTVHTEAACVLGWLDIDDALHLADVDSRWTTLAYAASHPR